MTDCNQLPNTSSVAGTELINCSRNQDITYCYEAPFSEFIKGRFNMVHIVATCCLMPIVCYSLIFVLISQVIYTHEDSRVRMFDNKILRGILESGRAQVI